MQRRFAVALILWKTPSYKQDRKGVDNMEPWQQEALHQLQIDRRREERPRCHRCEEPILSEQYLDLEPFGIGAMVCEECVAENMRFTADIV